MTPDEWRAINKLLRGIQYTVWFLAATIVVFFVLAVVGGSQNKIRELEKVRREQARQDEQVERIMGAIGRFQDQLKGVSERVELGERERAHLRGSTDEMRKTVIETLKGLEPRR